jgi:hypothetical protein
MRNVLILAGLAALCLGCSPASRYHGTWQTSVPVANQAASGTTTFSPDGKLLINLKLTSPLGTLAIADKGSWALEGEKIKIAITEQNWTPELQNSPAKAIAEALINSAKGSAKKAFEDAGPIQANWTGNDTFTLTAGSTYTFTRQK